MHTDALDALRDLYQELEREQPTLAGPCRACGTCCHFDTADHVLYASALELRYLIRACGHRPPRNAQRCPYQKGTQCAARDGRLLGCRLHTCNPAAGRDHIQARSQYYHDRLKRIHDHHAIAWRYAPFLQTLAATPPTPNP